MWWINKLFCVYALLFVTADGLSLNLQDVSLIANEIERWATYEQESELFKNAIELLKIPTELQMTDWRSYSNGMDAVICTICQSTIKSFINMWREGASEEFLREKVTKYCIMLNLQTENVCKNIIELNLPIISYIVDAKPNLTASDICGVVLDSRYCPQTDPNFDWSIRVDINSPVEIAKNETAEDIKILQITDLHYDPIYEPYGIAYCSEPCCCRKGQNATNSNSTVAGYWGDYGFCDTPWHAIVDALDHAGETHQDVSYVYFTGDVVDHGVWATTQHGNTESLVRSFEKMYETFKGTPVYPTLGNHEPHPLNLFAPTEITQDGLTTNWLYELMADMWIGFGWLPESTRTTILQGGFYTVSPAKGFRIIAVNSNVCYCYNWWIWHSPRDPYGQLEWLQATLLEAEKNKEFVHILSHVPANHKDCVRTWKREYQRIVNRFSHLITAEFNGHTHSDEVAIFYDSQSRAKNVAWNGGSVTGFANLNPNYKVYLVNGSNYAVTDFDNWMYDLSSANRNPDVRPTWYKSYSFKEEYNLPDLSPKSLGNWLSAAASDETMLDKYYRHFYKQAEPSLNKKCDSECKKEYLCRIIATQTANAKELCNNILTV